MPSFANIKHSWIIISICLTVPSCCGVYAQEQLHLEHLKPCHSLKQSPLNYSLFARSEVPCWVQWLGYGLDSQSCILAGGGIFLIAITSKPVWELTWPPITYILRNLSSGLEWLPSEVLTIDCSLLVRLRITLHPIHLYDIGAQLSGGTYSVTFF